MGHRTEKRHIEEGRKEFHISPVTSPLPPGSRLCLENSEYSENNELAGSEDLGRRRVRQRPEWGHPGVISVLRR